MMNFGKWYKQDYFDAIEFDATGLSKVTKLFNNNPLIINRSTKSVLQGYLDENKAKQEIVGVQSFCLNTCYPGLLCGVGYPHEINPDKKLSESDDESVELFSLGMYFDHTTGLPYIPGSSIKGALRSAIEEWGFLDSDLWRKVIKGTEHENSSINSGAFVQTVFEGAGSDNPYERDVFFDAIPIAVEGQLFGTDYITYHPSPLKNPNPVSFLRINPGVTYQFRMRLSNRGTILSSVSSAADLKKKLFESIILNFGLGAKTNHGYGQFEKKRC